MHGCAASRHATSTLSQTPSRLGHEYALVKQNPDRARHRARAGRGGEPRRPRSNGICLRFERSALGGIRTPNLLIRRSCETVRASSCTLKARTQRKAVVGVCPPRSTVSVSKALAAQSLRDRLFDFFVS